MKKNKGSQGKGRPRIGTAKLAAPIKEHPSPKLEEIGITHKQSSQWQKIARIPKEKFEKKIETSKEKKELLTTNTVLNYMKKYKLECSWLVNPCLDSFFAFVC